MNGFNRIETDIEGLLVIEPKVFGDHRGFFMESYSKKAFSEIGIDVEFVQDNHSKSSKNVLRGIHFQKNYSQGKLVRVVKGSVYDVAVDLRIKSKTFGQWVGITLSEENKKMFYMPPGFGHGFLTLDEATEFLYKTTDYYHPEDEGGIIYNDVTLNIDWPNDQVAYKLSDKDQKLMTFEKYVSII